MDDTPRSRGLWWKASLALIALLLLTAFLGHAVWTARERANVTARVAAVRALGEPVDAKDLVERVIPDVQNAAVAFRDAAAAYVEPSDRRQRRRDIEADDAHAFELPLTDEELRVLRATVAGNAATLAALDTVTTRPAVAWGDPTTPGLPRMFQSMTSLGQARTLGDLLADAAKVAAYDRVPAAALGRLAAIDAEARAVNAERTLVASLVFSSLDALAAETTLQLAPRLTLDAPADRDAARAWIALLLDDATFARLWRDGLLGERVNVREAFAAMRAGNMNPTGVAVAAPSVAQGVAGYVMSPMLYASEAAVLDVSAAVLPLLDAPSLTDFNARATTLRQVERDIRGSRLTLFAEVLAPSYERINDVRYRTLTDRHLAAVAVAIRLYAADHAGALPQTLDALVPDELPRVPLDAIDGNSLRYDPTRAIVWSVGADGVDDGGDETVTSPNDAGDLWQMRDAVVHLTPTTRPATQP